MENMDELWMTKLPDHKKLVLLNIPGSHDSTSYYMNFFGGQYAKTQFYNITKQLKMGVRKFDVRVGNFKPNIFQKKLSKKDKDDDKDFICCHGICDCFSDNKKKKRLTYKEVLLELKEFLKDHPGETIILETDSARDNRYENVKRSIEIRDKTVGDITINFDKNLTLGESRGKIVCTSFKMNENDENGKPIYNMNNIGGRGINDIHFNLGENYSTWEVDGKTKIQELTILFEIAKDFKFVEEDFITNSNNYPLVFSISCTGEKKNKLFFPDPKAQSDVVKPFIMKYEFKKEHYYGWMHIDFVDQDIAKKIIDTNFP